jgi:hypothetical protein
MVRALILLALLTAVGCKKPKAVEAPPEPPPAARREDRPRVLAPAEVKAKVEDAEKLHEDHMDKRFDEAQKQGQ